MNSKQNAKVSSPVSLDPSPEQIRTMGYAAVAAVADYFASLPSRSIVPDTTSQALKAQLSREVPIEGIDFETLLPFVQEILFASSRHNGHPRFFGYVASPGTAATALADLLASALNPNVTSWRSAPGPTEVERQTIGWIKQILGYVPEAEGLFVSGGSMANLCGLAAARDAKASIPVTATGCQALGRAMRLYISEEGHHSIHKAAGMLGIGRDNVRSVPVNARFQMDGEALESFILEDLNWGHLPFCLVASAGTVNTGACDDLEALADIAARYNLWLHIDASYGGFAALAPTRRGLFCGMERADSIALDPHKWLYVPLDCGCILYRDPQRAWAAFSQEAEYTRVIEHQAEEAYAYWDYGPELSRRFRALKVWMMLSHVGTRMLGEAIEDNCACAEYIARLIEQSDDLALMAPVTLSIFCFRFMPPDWQADYRTATPEQRQVLDQKLDLLNERLLTVLNQSGSSYLSNARLQGRFALRGCILNYRTTEQDMEILLKDVRVAAQRCLAAGDYS